MEVVARGLTFDVHAGGAADGPPVLLLHGFPQHAGMWDEVSATLHTAGMRTYAPNQRGYSPGTRVSDVDSYRMSNCVADAVALLDALDLAAVDLVGHDWGSVVGWHLAAAYPDRIRTFTAVSVPHPGAVARARYLDDQRERSAYMKLFAIEGKAEEVLLESDARRLRALFRPLPPERVDRYVEPLLAPGALTGALNWYRRLERPNLPPVRVPVTFVWGALDPAISPESARGCHLFVEAGVPYRFVELPDLGHWIPDLRPDIIAAETLSLITTKALP